MTKTSARVDAPQRPRGSALLAAASLLVMSLLVLVLGAGTSGATSAPRAGDANLDRAVPVSRSAERLVPTLPDVAPPAAPVAPVAAAPAPIVPVAKPTPTPRPTPRPVTQAPTVPAPAPAVRSYALRIAVTTSPDGAQAALDSCVGPVEIMWPSDTPEIAEHDFCGGTAFSSLATGTIVNVSGGTLGGTYVVNGNRRYSTPGASSTVVDGLGDVVLQTCVGTNSLVLVGLTRIG